MFNDSDLAQLEARGISPAEAGRQLSLFKNPPAPAALLRACVPGDGVRVLDAAEQARYEALGAAAMGSGRATKFVPASGAATRMFQALQAEPQGKAAQEVLSEIHHFAFAAELSSEPDKLAAILRRYASLPKALIPFHWHGDHSHTAFEDHLREAQFLGVKKLHFTISPEHRAGFEALLKTMGQGLEVSFSEQKPSTDTLAGAADGGPFRDASGKLVFRPGGHGALLENLNDLGADLVLIKNIDNISHSRLWENQLRWKKILLGLLCDNLASDRPSRVCGVVKNTGEPGGGPFWVKGSSPIGAASAQIVESAQINLKDPAQKKIFESATHFNPVDLACSVKGFDLRKFRDDSAVFISQKSKLGLPLQALELPGLWNGAMAHWHTIFVEVPAETFNPVKTVNDLLRPAHQPQ
jgi:hypothetical protein